MNESTIYLNQIFTKFDKKKDGIFFSPPEIIKILFEKVVSYIKNDLNKENDFNKIKDILEPACGSCEFVDYLQNNGFEHSNIDCIEYNKTIYNTISKVVRKNVKYTYSDFLHYDIENNKKYDLIIGNPPYFVISLKNIPFHFIGKTEEEKYFEGRPQIFILFLFHALHKLKENGILGFVLPKNIMNSHYYKKMRKYIDEHYQLLELLDFSNIPFLDTTQETIGIIIQNKKVDKSELDSINKYNFIIDNNFIWTFYKNELVSLYKNATSLHMLGFSVKTGTITWNEHKSKLTCDTKKTLLIYNTNIEQNKLVIKEFKNEEKKQFIEIDGKSEPLPIIVCNRGHGNSKYKMNFCYIDEKMIKNMNIQSVIIENHLNIIYHKTACYEDKVNMMKKIATQMGNTEKVQKWCNLFLGNNGFSKTELEYYFPIYNI
jgi:hypothetical protein